MVNAAGRLGGLVGAALLTCAAAHADDSAMSGAGAHTCGKYAEFYRQNPKLADELFYTWTQGFMSAMNLANADKHVYVNLNGQSSDDQKFFLRQYCNTHPLAQFTEAIVALMAALPRHPLPQ